MATQKPNPNPTTTSVSGTLSGTATRLRTGKTHPMNRVWSRANTPKPTTRNITGSGHHQPGSQHPMPPLTRQRSSTPASPAHVRTGAENPAPTRSNTTSQGGTTRRVRLRFRLLPHRRRHRLRNPKASSWGRAIPSGHVGGRRVRALLTRPSWRVRRERSDR